MMGKFCYFKMMRKITDITGRIFGKLKVVGESHRSNKYVYWKYQCECGEYGTGTASDLKRNKPKACQKCRDKESREAIVNRLYYIYKTEALKRRLEFSLTIDQFKIFIAGDCRYCGVEPRQIYKKKDWKYDLIYNGIDRINNELGYVISNCVSCCKFCNIVKNKFTEVEFKDWINRCLNHTLSASNRIE